MDSRHDSILLFALAHLPSPPLLRRLRSSSSRGSLLKVGSSLAIPTVLFYYDRLSVVPNPNYVYSEVDLALDLDKKSGPHTANMKHCFFFSAGVWKPFRCDRCDGPFFRRCKNQWPLTAAEGGTMAEDIINDCQTREDFGQPPSPGSAP